MEAIEVLSTDCYLGKLADVDDGRSSFTHIANVRHKGKISRFHVKLFSNYKQLCNEITAFILARLNKQPIPETACVLKMSKQDVLLAFPTAKVNSDCYAWATKSISGRTPNSYFKDGTQEGNLALQALAKLKGVASLIAFDNLLANQDRNMGNVILSGDLSKFWIFDHDQSPFSPAWNEADLIPDRDSFCKLSMALFPGGIPHDIKSLVVEASKEHEANCGNLDKYASSWWPYFLTKSEAKALSDFFKTRSQYSESRLLKKMNLLC